MLILCITSIGATRGGHTSQIGPIKKNKQNSTPQRQPGDRGRFRASYTRSRGILLPRYSATTTSPGTPSTVTTAVLGYQHASAVIRVFRGGLTLPRDI